MPGKFIVIYGINNLGKSTQAKLLTEKLTSLGRTAEYVKYPIYELAPAGPLINSYLRQGNPQNFSPRELQLLHYIDRISFEPQLGGLLQAGHDVVAEDYFGTALAWGAGAGIDLDLLEHFYSFIRPEDIAILLDGQRFTEAIEQSHAHETNEALIQKVRQIHLDLAKKHGWHIIHANQPPERVADDIWKIVEPLLKK
ncbi:hypothetical protein HY933_03445 [Candidatus Falkowbacteria bacterium]|nr:hypothetical protein [Candidatus Falkowbacteria bacterium]